MRFKLGFSGTHGTGKTTLVYGIAAALQRSGHNVAIVNETARQTQFAINDEACFLAEIDILARQIRDELDAEVRPVDFIITDRTSMDVIAYTQLAEQTGTIEKGVADDMLPLATRWLQTYDKVFYIKPAFDIEEKITESHDYDHDDGERWASYEAMKAIDDILYNLYIDKTDSELTVIDSSCPLSERADIVLQLLLEAIKKVEK